MLFLRKIYWAITVPVTSFVGFYNLKIIKEKNDRKEWGISFKNKKILIVGTGPSLDKVSKDYFLNFDTIVYINHAIKCFGKVKDEYFFSTDVGVVKDIKKKNYYNNISILGKGKSILAPIFFQQTLCLKKDFKSDFSWIIANKAKYKVHWVNKTVLGLRHPVTAVYWPEQPDTNQLNIWFSKKNQTHFFPVIESTSALSAILFAAKYRPKNISLIGCDFGMGRSKSIINDCPASVTNAFTGAKEKFYFLENYFLKESIPINNDSWK